MTAWTTRPETPADVPAVHTIVAAAFPTRDEADLVDALRGDPHAWIDGLSMLAVDDHGTPAGYALLTRCHIGDTPALALAPCAVLPAAQRTGAGTAAIRAVLDAARNRARENLVVVLGHAGYYPRFGFTRASGFAVSAPIDVPDEALMALALDPQRPVPAGTIRWAHAFGI
jgi:predicted N-acetyltransferase YhbS